MGACSLAAAAYFKPVPDTHERLGRGIRLGWTQVFWDTQNNKLLCILGFFAIQSDQNNEALPAQPCPPGSSKTLQISNPLAPTLHPTMTTQECLPSLRLGEDNHLPTGLSLNR